MQRCGVHAIRNTLKQCFSQCVISFLLFFSMYNLSGYVYIDTLHKCCDKPFLGCMRGSVCVCVFVLRIFKFLTSTYFSHVHENDAVAYFGCCYFKFRLYISFSLLLPIFLLK